MSKKEIERVATIVEGLLKMTTILMDKQVEQEKRLVKVEDTVEAITGASRS